MLRLSVFFVCALAAAATAAPGAPLPLGESGVQLAVPDGWKTVANPDGSMQVVHPETGAALVVLPVPAGAVSTALESLDKELERRFTGVKMPAPGRGALDGMPAMISTGTGTLDGQAVDLALMLLEPGPAWRVLLLGMAPRSSGRAAGDAMSALLAGLKAPPRPPVDAAPPPAAKPAPKAPPPAPAEPPPADRSPSTIEL